MVPWFTNRGPGTTYEHGHNQQAEETKEDKHHGY